MQCEASSETGRKLVDRLNDLVLLMDPQHTISEKTALRVMPVFSPLGHPSLDSPPAEGRAPHARGKGIGSTRAYPR
jgi:hypothetical protein